MPIIGDNVIHNRQRYPSLQAYRDSLTHDARALYDLERLDNERYYSDIRADRTVYVTVYARVLRYGGPEEGGWWYDTWHLDPENPVWSSHNVRDSVQNNLESATTWCKMQNGSLPPYHHTNGGLEYVPRIELKRGAHVDIVRQRYS